VHFTTAIPKTRNGKLMRRVLRAAYLGEDPGDITALENLQSLQPIEEAGIMRAKLIKGNG
jgi:acetyl-CoA synthetase